MKQIVKYGCLMLLFLFMSIFYYPDICNASEKETTVTDASHKKVTITAKVDRICITCYGGVANQIIVLGAADKIVAQPSIKPFPQLLKMKPELAAIPDAGSFNNINIEEIVKLHPDVVFAGIISKKGNSKIEEMGLPLVTMYIGKARIKNMQEEFLRTGEILGKQDRAKALVAYWSDKLDLIKKRIASIPADKRLRVYYAGGSGILHTEGSAWWTQDLLTIAGGENVAASIGQARETTMEQLLQWDPDVIVVSNNARLDKKNKAGSKVGKFLEKQDRVKQILENPQLANIKATKTGRVYGFPVGAFWWERPSPESPLGFLWLTKKLYPELMQDIDIKKETKYFYKTFFEYDLSDEEYETFLNPLQS